MRQLSVSQLKEWLESGEHMPVIVDVREPWEYAICHIEPSRLIPMREIPSRLNEIGQGDPVAVLCHHGIRSQKVAQFLEQRGFHNVYNVYGGIDAWAREIDPTMNHY